MRTLDAIIRNSYHDLGQVLLVWVLGPLGCVALRICPPFQGAWTIAPAISGSLLVLYHEEALAKKGIGSPIRPIVIMKERRLKGRPYIYFRFQDDLQSSKIMAQDCYEEPERPLFHTFWGKG